MTRDRLIRMLIALLMGLAAMLGYLAWEIWQDMQRQERMAAASQESAAAAGRPDLGGPFTLVNGAGEPVTEADFAGEFMLVYFGFTYCPDVCPTELANMARAIDQLDAEIADQVQPVFITVDPERDTPEAVGDYVDLFHPRMVGLTGSEQQIRRVTQAYRVFYQRVDSPEFADYQMDHSSFVYLMGPAGENLAVFGPQTPADAMAATVARRVNDYSPDAARPQS